MDNTFNEIQLLATEQHNLYRAAGKAHLTKTQQQRLSEIQARLPMLWDLHRRELASRNTRRPQTATFRMDEAA